MANVMAVAVQIVAIVCIVILAICIWKTAEYFNRLPEKDSGKGILAWNTLMLTLALIALIVRLIMM